MAGGTQLRRSQAGTRAQDLASQVPTLSSSSPVLSLLPAWTGPQRIAAFSHLAALPIGPAGPGGARCGAGRGGVQIVFS